jgi:hypothetical protein
LLAVSRRPAKPGDGKTTEPAEDDVNARRLALQERVTTSSALARETADPSYTNA